MLDVLPISLKPCAASTARLFASHSDERASTSTTSPPCATVTFVEPAVASKASFPARGGGYAAPEPQLTMKSFTSVVNSEQGGREGGHPVLNSASHFAPRSPTAQ